MIEYVHFKKTYFRPITIIAKERIWIVTYSVADAIGFYSSSCLLYSGPEISITSSQLVKAAVCYFSQIFQDLRNHG